MRGNGGYSKSVPPTRHIPQEEDEVEYEYAESPKRAKTTQRVYPAAKPTRRFQKTRFHPLVFFGIGLFIMIIGWLSFSALSNWWSGKVNDWTYGVPRTYQTDAVVGHGDSAAHPSHFITINLNGKIEVIEIPGGDPDLIIHIQGSDKLICFPNNGKTFNSTSQQH